MKGIFLYSSLESGCDENLVSYIHNGHSTMKGDGAVFTFYCKEEGVLEGPSMVFCDGKQWNDTPPQCLGKCSIVLQRVILDHQLFFNILVLIFF